MISPNTRYSSLINSQLNEWQRPSSLMVLLWLASMLALPILFWIYGDQVLPLAISVSAVLQATAVFMILVDIWGIKKTVKTAVLIAILTFLAEYIGSHTGLPFGNYHYTSQLQPQMGGVPLLIPVAWFMMLAPAWAVAPANKPVGFILSGAAALTAWDLLLDPQMVNWNLWQWDQPGLYFGIPLLNYFGWFLTATVITAVCGWSNTRQWGIRINGIARQQLVLIYTVTWFLEAFGLILFWGMPGPGIIGGLVMGGFVWFGWRRKHTQQQGVK